MVRVPLVHHELTTSRVLVMELLPGRPLSSAGAALDAVPASQRGQLAEDLLGAVLRQVLVTGVFHADLHPGNVLLDSDGPGLGLLDFGSVGRLDRGARTSVGLLMVAVDRQDAVAVSQALLDLLDGPTGLDHRAFERDAGQLVMRFGSVSGHAEALFQHLLRMVLRHGLTVPPPVAAAFRALAALEGTLRLLDPAVDLVGAARARGRDVVAERLTPAAIQAELLDQLAALVPMVQRLPRRLATVVDDLQQGSLTVTVRALQDPAERHFLTSLVQQLVVTVLSATAAVCGVILALAGRGPVLAGDLRLTTYLGLVWVLYGFVLGCRVVVLVFRSAWNQRAADPLTRQRTW